MGQSEITRSRVHNCMVITSTCDANGNRLSDASGVYSYASASNRLSSIPSGAVSVDAAGNVNRVASSVYRYTYDGVGRLANATDAGMVAISYGYNYQTNARAALPTRAYMDRR